MRYAIRRLWKAPGYTLAATTTLALAIGASTAMFSAVSAVLLKPMPIREPDRLMVAWGTSDALNMKLIELSYLDVQDIGETTAHVGRVQAHGSSAWTDVLEADDMYVRPRKPRSARRRVSGKERHAIAWGPRSAPWRGSAIRARS
jgi:hypothetical protein